jgi:hypothetical protein
MTEVMTQRANKADFPDGALEFETLRGAVKG